MQGIFQEAQLASVMKGEFTDEKEKRQVEYYKIQVLSSVDKGGKKGLVVYEFACGKELYAKLENLPPLKPIILTVEVSPAGSERKWFKAVDVKIPK